MELHATTTQSPVSVVTMWSPKLCGSDMTDNEKRLRLNKRAIDALLPASKRTIYWDDELSGFGLRIEASGRKTFLVRYRPGGGRNAPKRFMTVGSYGKLTPEEARAEARRLLSAGNLGLDPAACQWRRQIVPDGGVKVYQSGSEKRAMTPVVQLGSAGARYEPRGA